jgi:transaldolase
MKFFVDTGNLDDIKKLAALGIVDGVTTNPSLMAKEKGDPAEIIRSICRIVQGPVSAEVLATDAAGMVAEGTTLAAIDPHVVVKVPFTPAGVQATKRLAGAGHRVNVTLVFSPAQALIAAKVGAAYVSPFIGRLDDIASDGMGLVRQIVEIYRNYTFKTEVLVASVRHPMHIVEAARVHLPAGGARSVLQTPAHGHRTREVSERLARGKSGVGSQKSEVTSNFEVRMENGAPGLQTRGTEVRTEPRVVRPGEYSWTIVSRNSNGWPSWGAAKAGCAGSTKQASSRRANASTCCSMPARSRKPTSS